MGIFESQEWLFDLISDKFSDVSGIRTGIEEDTVVYSKNGMNLWMRICGALKIKADFVPHLLTIEDYVHEFSSILQKHNAQRKEFLQKLTAFVAQKTGQIFQPQEIIFSNLLPHSDDAAQHLREEMNYELKLGNLKNLVRNQYKYFKYKAAFAEAKTLNNMTDVLFGKEYPDVL